MMLSPLLVVVALYLACSPFSMLVEHQTSPFLVETSVAL
jgi:hypothetical protein